MDFNVKDYAKIYISINENLNTEEKILLKNFVQENNEDDVWNLLITGEPKKNSLAKYNINDIKKYITEGLDWGGIVNNGAKLAPAEIVVGQLAAAAVVALLIYGGVKIYRNFISKSGRACSKFKGEEKASCIKKFENEALKLQIKYLESEKTKCNKSKDPEKCLNKIEKRILFLKTKLGAK